MPIDERRQLHERSRAPDREPGLFRVLVTDELPLDALQPLRDFGFHVDFRPGISPADLLQSVPGYHALLIRSETKVTADVLNSGKDLRVILRAGVGVDNVDVRAATEKGIQVANSPDTNTNSAAEHSIGLMLAATKNITVSHVEMTAGKWERVDKKGMELKGKTFGVVGYGNVGRPAAEIAKGFGMNIAVVDQRMTEDMAERLGVTLYRSLDELLEVSDVVSLHLPLNDQTRHIIGEEQLKKMKPTAFLVNAARGGLVDEKALVDALDKGIIAGAALDTYEGEPHVNPHVLEHPRIAKTSHLGGSTREAQDAAASDVAQQLIDFFEERPVRGAINGIRISPEERRSLGSHPEVAERMAAFAFALSPNKRISTVEVTYSGDLANLDTRILQASVVRGLFSRDTSETINDVSWREVADRRGIAIRELKDSEAGGGYANLMTIKLTHEGGQLEVSAINAHDGPRIVGINQYPVDFPLNGNTLVCENTNIPGALNAITEKLADFEINIRNVSLAPDRELGTALTVLTLDDAITTEQASQITEHPAIISAVSV